MKALKQAVARAWASRPKGSIPLCLLFALFLSACAPRLTAENVAKIKTGMTPDQVRAILGNPDTTKSQGAIGLTSTTYTYRKDSSEIRIVFLNDRVMATQGSIK